MQKTPKTRATSITDFRLLKVLGKGTYGQVFRAIHLPSGTEVAIKKINVLGNDNELVC